MSLHLIMSSISTTRPWRVGSLWCMKKVFQSLIIFVIALFVLGNVEQAFAIDPGAKKKNEEVVKQIPKNETGEIRWGCVERPKTTPVCVKVKPGDTYSGVGQFESEEACKARCSTQQEYQELFNAAMPTAAPKPGPIAGPSKCNNGNGISTALGCIPVNTTNDFIAWFLRWFIGIAGGIAFLMIVFSSFQIMTASGDPQKLQGGRELLTAAISGLILIIFSVFLLRLIGVTILNIPGL